METVTGFVFLDSKITADGDCSHEMKRHLLLGRKTMIKLDSILKSRAITLPTKVLIVKPMVFPVVMYRCESWTIKAKGVKFLNCGVGEDSWVSLGQQGDQTSLSKGNQPYILIGSDDAKLKLQYFGHVMWKAYSLDKTLMLEKIAGKRRIGWQRMR